MKTSAQIETAGERILTVSESDILEDQLLVFRRLTLDSELLHSFSPSKEIPSITTLNELLRKQLLRLKSA